MESLLVVAIVCCASLLVPGKPLRNALANGRSRGGGFNLNQALPGLIAIAVISSTGAVHAADTVETWDVGATDVDFYLGAEGLGLPRDQGSLFGDIMLGYGLVERFSAYLGTTFQTDRLLDQSDPQHYLGLFGTAYESDHVDFDLFLDFSSSGSGAAVTSAFELNLDHTADMSTFGFYLRGGVVFENNPADSGTPGSEPEIGHTVEINPGLYWSLAERGQFLVEYSTGYLPHPTEGGGNWQDGHVHLGYNHVLNDALELITEVSFATEKPDDAAPWATFVGIIATLPSAGK